MTAMTRVGEATGRLERSLLALGEHYQHELTTRRMFIQSIAWPMLQLIAGIGVISLLIYLMGILVPAGGGKMADILGFGLYGPSGVLKFWLYLAIFFGGLWLMLWAFLRNVAGRAELDSIAVHDPRHWPIDPDNRDLAVLLDNGDRARFWPGPHSLHSLVARQHQQ